MKKVMIHILVFFFIFSGSSLAKETTVNYRLKWLFNTSVAGDIYADVKGHFKKVGLRVNVNEGSPEKKRHK